MSLKFIIGNSGAGKSYRSFNKIIEESMGDPTGCYYVIVPEQFTMQTQKTLVEMHPRGGIINIDVLSFARLAYRIFEEVGGDSRDALEETGKSLVLAKIIQEQKKNMPYLGGMMTKPGCLDEMKSLFSEFLQYDIGREELHQMVEDSASKGLLNMKLKDVEVLYGAYLDYLKDHYITGEEIMDMLCRLLPLSDRMKGATFILDGFTGFTPIQHRVIKELLNLGKKVYVTVTMDHGEDLWGKYKPHQLFAMSHRMIRSLSKLTDQIDEPERIGPDENSRHAAAPAISFLEQNIFRYNHKTFDKEQEEIQIFAAPSPAEEIRETARRIRALVREKGYNYGDIAVISGDLQSSKSLIMERFDAAAIPYFLDEKHTIMLNPFIEYIRSAMEMTVQGYSYETVFRFLRCGMSNLSTEEIDAMENYVRAFGIRGWKRWSNPWEKLNEYRLPGADLTALNQSREKFVEETLSLNEAFKGRGKTVREYCTGLYNFIASNNIQKKLSEKEKYFHGAGEKALEKEYSQIYAIIMNLLDTMVEILGDEKVSRKDFGQLLETGLSQTKIALIPPNTDQVLVGDIERTRLKDIKALFFIDVNEGNIPKGADGGGFLNEDDRDFIKDKGIELAPGPKELMNMQLFYLYQNMTKPADHLYLSYHTSSPQGDVCAPAFLIHNVKKLYPAMQVEYLQNNAKSPQGTEDALLPETEDHGMEVFLGKLGRLKEEPADDLFAELYSWFLNSPKWADRAKDLVEAGFSRRPYDKISKAVAEALYGHISLEGATRLERYAACAYAHFLIYGLRLRERSEYEFSRADFGTIIHNSLEDFAKELKARHIDWKDVTEKDQEEIGQLCLMRQIPSANNGSGILEDSARNAYMVNRMRRYLRRTIWALTDQVRRGSFIPEGFEVSVDRGRIDRLDILETDDKVYVKIIDYKTGNTKFDLVTLYHGLSLQLFVYLNAAVRREELRHPDKEVIPAGIFYYHVDDPLLKEKSLGDLIEADISDLEGRLRKELKLNGLVNADREIIDWLDSSGESLPVSFNKDGSLSKRSTAVSTDQFRALQSFVSRKLTDIREEIGEGNAQVNPYLLGQKDACQYCPGHGVCGYDPKIAGYMHRRLKQFSDDQIWELIYQM